MTNIPIADTNHRASLLKEAGEIDIHLQSMFADVFQADPLYWPSPFWAELNDWGIKNLKNSSINNFKRTLNMRYFNWNVFTIFVHQFFPVLLLWLRRGDLSISNAKFPNYQNDDPRIPTFNVLSAYLYKIYVAMFWSVLSDVDSQGLCPRLSEPNFGAPYIIQYKENYVSQDLANSLHEYYSIMNHIDGGRQNFKNIGEIGAGYGRLAYVFLKAMPGCSYTIIDIPPALYVAQKYLSGIFPEKKIFLFRPFSNYQSIQKEFESSQIRLISAPQVELLPDKSFDVMINISSLHEMTLAQINHYIRHIDRLTNGYFYTKQWLVSRAKRNGFVIRREEYPIPQAWDTLFNEKHPIQKLFFHALYKNYSNSPVR
ncbi:MAG: putative sugar O-methyltransferase [Candidatus Omnitrophica bacterium]|nr:putative sugar O-methyltransferase [Candidatus Omnitrophota bacterium]